MTTSARPRRPFVGGNWKMYTDRAREALKLWLATEETVPA